MEVTKGRGMLCSSVGVLCSSSSRVSPLADWKMGIRAGALLSAKSCKPMHSLRFPCMPAWLQDGL